ncbi:MAG: hypothetical protein IJZ03_08095 [Clostridia bacterium]|nr:hypothetical protein [Clostridia bacterium]
MKKTSDADYLNAVNRGDMETAQRMVDEAATMLNEYKGGHQNYPIAHDVVDRFVRDYKSGRKTLLPPPGKQFSLRNNAEVDNYTEEQYNNFGWARYAEAISFNELEDLYSKIQEKGSLRRFKHSANGEAIIEVNNKPKTSLDVDNVFVFVTGTKNVPKITRVLRVALFNENDMEKVRKHIYAREQKYSNARTSAIVGNIYFEELVFEYRREDFGDYQEYRNEIGKQSSRSESEGDPGTYRDRDQREGTAYETESGITSNDEISYSLRNRTQEVGETENALQKANAGLKADVEHFRRLAKLTEGAVFTKSSVEAAAKWLMNNNDVEGHSGELRLLLTNRRTP